MDKETQTQRMLRRAVQAFILLAAAGLSAVTAIRIAIQGREVEVPDVVKLKAGDAQVELSRRGLGIKIADRIFSELPSDYVVRQSPPPGSVVKTGQRAHVVLSSGPQKVSVPGLEGSSIRAARVQLLQSGLQLGELTLYPTSGAEPDQVLRQYPPPKATNVSGPRVNVLVSAPEKPESFVMPDYVGLPLSEVPGRISAARLRLARISFVPYPQAARSTVIAQTPPRGSRITVGANVELQVVE
jgi:serine/threonine-protein kinase